MQGRLWAHPCAAADREAQQPSGGFPGGSAVKKPTQETQLRSPGREDSLEEERATPSTVPAGETPRTGEMGGLQSMGSQRVGHN